MATGFTILFGGIDLFLRQPRFFRLEPFVHNLVIATVFLVTVCLKIPLMQRFAAALPDFLRPNPADLSASYMNKVSWAWILYLYLKSVFYLYLGLHTDLGSLILLRTVVGTGTLMMMFGGEWWIRTRKARS